jgi:hypothetical protein
VGDDAREHLDNATRIKIDHDFSKYKEVTVARRVNADAGARSQATGYIERLRTTRKKLTCHSENVGRGYAVFATPMRSRHCKGGVRANSGQPLYEKETDNVSTNDHRGARKPMTFP